MLPHTKVDLFSVAVGASVKTFAQLLQDVSQVTPVPGLAPAATVVLTILALCQSVAVNQEEARYLADRCVHLLMVLREGSKGLEESQVTGAVQRTCLTLDAIRHRYEIWAGYSRFDKLIMSNRTSSEIAACHREISRCLEELGVAGALESAQWQLEADKSRQRDHEEVVNKLDVLLEGQIDSKDQIVNMAQTNQDNHKELIQLMGSMQEAMQRFEMGDRRHTDLQEKLINVKDATGELPPLTELRGKEVRRIGQHPVAMGAQFDIWEGEYMGREKVALKVLRGVHAKPRQLERFHRESTIWRQVWEKDRGQYIVAYYGTVTDDGPYPYIVSPWQHNGTAIAWVQKNPDVDRIQLIKGIARGLELLHTWKPDAIVHGDIKGENILIGDRGQPLISDFSLSKILENVTGTPFTQSKGISDSYRWFAPEICSAPGILSPESDMFAFGMTMIELITGEVPYAEVRRTTEVLFNMQKGKRPERPQGARYLSRGLNDNVWELMQRCWIHDPQQRIAIEEFLRLLG